MKVCRFAAAITMLLLLLNGCSTLAPMRHPSGLAAAATPGATETAIRRALAQRNWAYAVSAADETFVAELRVRKHRVRIAIDYGGERIVFRYLDSDNLSYEEDGDGVALIHRKYNQWIANLAQDIRRFLVAGD